MFGVGKVFSVGVSAIVAGFVFVSASSAATVGVTKANPLLDVPLLESMILGGDHVNSGALPDGGTWYDTSMVPTPGKTLVQGDVLNTYKSPWSGSTKSLSDYWTTGTDASPSPNAPNPGVLLFDHQHTKLTMLWGSVDIYNSLSFYLGATLIDTITGSDILALDSNITKGAGAVLLDFLVSGGGTFDRLVFSSSVNAFEVSNITVDPSNTPNAVPVPPTLILLGSVLAGLGLIGSRRRRDVSFG